MNLGLPEILVILVIVLLLFGGKRLPELARSMGKALSEFRKGVKDVTSEAQSDAVSGDAPAGEADSATAKPSGKIRTK